MTRTAILLSLSALTACLGVACGSGDGPTGADAQTASDAGSGSQDSTQADGGADANYTSDAEPTGDGTDAPAPSACGDDQVTFTMTVDDSANQTYEQGELIWTGSFAWDAETNTISYATAWEPTDGPFPPLWDDGPVSEGGHEAEGSVAGDHIFSVAVCYEADVDRLFAYGMLNDELRWIWVGSNGLLEVPAGTTGVIAAQDMLIPPHGDRDFELTLDISDLHADYAAISLDTHKIFVKGTMNSWSPVQLLDSGTIGDATAGDGVVTYRHSLYLGAHDGLLRPGDEAQFVFVFAFGDTDPDQALEYKSIDTGDALPDGVSARMLCLDGWQPTDVLLSLDSKGVDENTAVVACPDDPDEPLEGSGTTDEQDAQDDTHDPDSTGSGGDPDAGPDEVCSTESPCPAGEVCVSGACFPEPDGDCDDNVPCTGAGEVCLDSLCVVPDSDPNLVLVLPAQGSIDGGTEVTLSGSGFAADSTVTFDGLAAQILSIEPNEVTTITPAHVEATVDVTITSPDGGFSTFPGGYTYVVTANAPFIDDVSPSSGPLSGNTPVTVTGGNFAPGAVVNFGTATASNVDVAGDGGSLTTTTPEHPIATVSVTVTNPDGQKTTKAAAFTFTPALPDWGKLDGPAALATVAGAPTAALTAQVYEEGVTAGQGAGFGITADVGYGPQGSDPTGSDAWTWTAAEYLAETGNNDVWSGTVSPPAGTWAATMRFSVTAGQAWLYVDLDGADNGFDPAQLAVAVVEEAGPVVISELAPAQVAVFGGAQVIVSGAGFDADCTLTVDGDPAEDAAFDDDAGTWSFTASAHPPGPAAVTVTCADGSGTALLTYVATWDGNLDEWQSAPLAANDVETNWGGANHLETLYATTDGTSLYVAVGGATQGDAGANAIAVWLDVDLGAGSGITSAATLTDADGAVDDVFTGVHAFAADGFGAEVGFASLDGASYDPATDDPGAASAGWRSFADPSNFPWLLDGAVHAGADGVEAILPLQTLLGDPTGTLHTLGLVARICNGTGEFVSNQAVPAGTSGTADEVLTGAAELTVLW